MAKVWKVSDAVKALRDGNLKARRDIGSRFPLFATATPEQVLDCVTDMTVRQIESRIKNGGKAPTRKAAATEAAEEAPKAKGKKGKGKAPKAEKAEAPAKAKKAKAKAEEAEDEGDDEDEDAEDSMFEDDDDED